MAHQVSNPGFGISGYLAALYSEAPIHEVKKEVAKLLTILGETDPALVDELTAKPVNQSVLNELVLWTNRLKSHPKRGRLGHAATQFYAAQALVGTVMRETTLDTSVVYSPGIERAIQRGADGLFEFGQPQFEDLTKVALDVVNWMLSKQSGSFAIIESPIGNTLPVQFFNDLAASRGIPSSIIQWNAPRNDRRSAGQTIADTAKAFVTKVGEFDHIIFVDEVVSATRYTKLLHAIDAHIPKEKLLAVALLFDDNLRLKSGNAQRRPRLIAELEARGRDIGFEKPVRAFPLLRQYRMDDGPVCQWATPVIWNDAEIIAGKRKENLIFVLVDHCLGILQDLGKPKSEFRPYLIRAWSQNTLGQSYAFKVGITQKLFQDIVTQLPLGQLHSFLLDKAKQKFPDDYAGDLAALAKTGASERWNWFRTAFVTEAEKRIGKELAWTAWNAIDAAFASSFPDHKPRARRDLDAAPYTLQFNSTISAFNHKLRELLMAKAS